MPNFRNLSLKHKQMLIIMVTSALSLLLACSAFVAYDVARFRRELVASTSSLADVVGYNLTAAIEFNDPETAERTLSALQGEPNITHAHVHTPDGKSFASYTRKGKTEAPEIPHSLTRRHEFIDNHLHLFHPIMQSGEQIATIELAADLNELRERLWRYAGIAGLVLLVSLLVAFWLSSRLQKLISNPILHLADVARFVAKNKDYSVRATQQSSDELGQLVHGFNEMLEQIQARDSALKAARDELEARVAERTSELQQTNDTLQQQQTELRVLFDLIPAMVWFKDTENRVLRLNEQAAVAIGLSIEEIEGKLSSELYPEDADRYYADDMEVIQSGVPRLGYVEQRTDADGQEKWIQTDKVPYCNNEGNVVGIVVMAQDISTRKNLEERLLQSQKMETVGKLAGGVAHEFNSILTVIIGQSELIQKHLPSDHPLSERAKAIYKAAERAATLTQQLIAYGRKTFLRPQEIDLNRIISNLENTIRHLVGGEVDVHFLPGKDLQTVQADSSQIEQVIINLAMNAAEAMPRGGALTLETENISISEDSVGRYKEMKPGDYVYLTVTDTGIGMNEAVKARAFEPFFTTKNVGQGTGLGLSTCYGIIKQSGGHISIYSEEGRGTSFKIYLPQIKPETIPTPQQSRSDLPGGTETILLAEDDPSLRERTTSLLKSLGYKVFAAGNGIEALNLRQQQNTGHIDLLFTDVVMPHMSGKELADRMRAVSPHTRVLFTSAYTEYSMTHQGTLDKDIALLQKPFTPSGLARKLREILDPRGKEDA